MRRFAYITLLLIVLPSASAQSPPKTEAPPAIVQTDSNWERYRARNEEFTALFPETPSMYRFEAGTSGTRYAAYSNGIIYSVTSLKYTGIKFPLQVFINNEIFANPTSEFKFVQDLKLNKFSGKQYTLRLSGYDGVVNFYLTSDHVYSIQAVGADASNPAVQKFLDSFTLGSKPDAKDIGLGARSASEATSSDQDNELVYKGSEVTRPLVVVHRLEAQHTKESAKNNVSGTVFLRAIFRASGKVTDIRVQSGLPFGLTESAIETVRKIYFIPAVKDGRHVSQQIEIQVNFGAPMKRWGHAR